MKDYRPFNKVCHNKSATLERLAINCVCVCVGGGGGGGGVGGGGDKCSFMGLQPSSSTPIVAKT